MNRRHHRGLARLVIPAIAAALGLASCDKPQSDSQSAPEGSADAAPQSSGPNLVVNNDDFDGTGGIAITSHDNRAVMLEKIVINNRSDPGCVYGSGAKMRAGQIPDGSTLPVRMQLGDERRPDEFSLQTCGEPITVTLVTDRGTADYSVGDHIK